ncbi:hypothetical protein AAE02nite_32110 [Adhaeribacter aerolatus]|uniref:Uncharacterized protein n=2 Tax=Adhaeribacter aerolatus TaxID=670289 RepID=A0A512B172_9BACT|nr:hypothetical protein AAE02nite_32110 [Adhaeribacter aerolatus]
MLLNKNYNISTFYVCGIFSNIKFIRAVGQETLKLLSNELNQYEVYIAKLISDKRYLSGKELTKELVNTFQIKDDNARKIIQRTVVKGILVSSNPLSFGNGQFIYLNPRDGLTLSLVKEVSKKHRPPIYRLLEAIDINDGVISYYEALKIVAAPLEKSSTKVNTLDEIIKELRLMKFIYEKTDSNNIKYILKEESKKEEGKEESLLSAHFSKMVIDGMFLPDILRWLQKSNIIDNYKTIYRNKKTPSIGAKQNNLVWDAFAYTKTTGINSTFGKKADTIEKQTLVVLDVVISRDYSQIDLDGFYNRIQINLNAVKNGRRKILPIIIYKTIAVDVLEKISSLGFIAFDLGSIFGTTIYDVVEKLNILQLKKVAAISDDFNVTIESALTTIRTSGQEDSLKDIRGVLFEFLLYPLLKHYYSSAEILHGKTLSIVKPEGGKENYEYDYIIKSSNPNEILIVELKGYSSLSKIPIGSSDTKNTLSWFFRRTLPFAKRHFQKEIQDTGKKFRGCFITSASFYEDGINFLNGINNGSFKPQNLNAFYDGQSLLKLLEENNYSKVKSTVEKFFIKSERL